MLSILMPVKPELTGKSQVQAGEQGWRSGESVSPPTNVARVRFSGSASYVG